MQPLAASELIINNRGAVYHIDAKPGEIASIVILVGDPDRVRVVSKYFDSIEHIKQHREFITHTGYVGKKRVTVLSTGIGPDNIDIAMNELDAIANIDFATRTIKPQHQTLHIFRFGTSGSLQSTIPVDSFVAATYGLGLDNVMHYYNIANTEKEKNIVDAFKAHVALPNQNVVPYLYEASQKLLPLFDKNYHQGITATCPGFYGPQGRVLRLGLAYPFLIDKLSSFEFEQNFVANFEMESAAIYGLGKALGHHCIGLNVIVANRVKKEFSKDSELAVENLIKHSLKVIADADL